MTEMGQTCPSCIIAKSEWDPTWQHWKGEDALDYNSTRGDVLFDDTSTRADRFVLGYNSIRGTCEVPVSGLFSATVAPNVTGCCCPQ